MNELEFEKILKQIMNADKTPEYEYFSGDEDNKNYLNAAGIAPSTGMRWSTPKEICRVYLKDIQDGTLDEALESLMGD